MSIINLQSITKIYRTKEVETIALENVNLEVKKGDFLSVMGPSGCGKSTMLNIMGLLDIPSNGKVLINNTETNSMKDKEMAEFRNKTLGFVFQSFHLINSLNVLDNVELPLLYRKSGDTSRREMAKHVLEKVGLSHRMKHFPSQLSGGQCQRVAIARAIIGNPQIILADEPTGNLDSKMGAEIMDLLFELNKSGLKRAVITEDAARALYGNENALGKTINIDFKPYIVAGIVRPVSQMFKYAVSDIYIPYTSRSGYEHGSFHIMFLAKSKQDFDKISEEVRAAERKFNATDKEWTLKLLGPYSHSVNLLNTSNNEPDIKGNTRKMVFVLLVLLLVPAINLSSFSLSRIKRRMEEIGVRKAFGAKKYIILIQVLYENLITSLIGGVIGLALSFAVVVWLKEWLLDMGDNSTIPLNALISLPVFIAVFVVCLLLNLLSAGIPAYRASNVNIVDSLNRNNI